MSNYWTTPMNPDAYCRYPLRVLVLLVLFFALLLGVVNRADAVQLTGKQCEDLAVWAADTVWAKHVGADKEKVRGWYQDQKSAVFVVLLRDFDKLWELDISYRVPLFNVVLDVCNQRRGVYPDET